MSTENQAVPQNPVPSSDAKGTVTTLPLPSPEPTPGVEDGRIEADRERVAAATEQASKVLSDTPDGATGSNGSEPPNEASARLEVITESRRILGCPDTSYAEILGVEIDSTAKEKEAAWKRLGCLLHKNVTDHPDAAKAFEKLQNAAEKLEVNHLPIEEVVQWDGKEKLPDDNDDGDTPMPEPVPNPPDNIKKIYHQATAALHQLGRDPDHQAALKHIHDCNQLISDFNSAMNTTLAADEAKISEDCWCIPLSFFSTHYNIVYKNQKILDGDRSNKSAREVIAKEKALIDMEIKQNHFPGDWAVVTADEYLQGRDKESAFAAGPAEAEKSAGVQAVIDYPWTTAKAADGSLIIGTRKQGRFGFRVCVETREEDGGVIRRLQSASETGLSEVEKYRKMTGAKDLAEGQSEWSCDDRDDFKQLLWVTKSHTKCKNTAAGKKNPSADCCVKFGSKGIQILTVSSLSKVLGSSSARAKIEDVCSRDNISPPWKAGNISEYHDPSRLEKDPVRRRHLQETQAASATDKHPDQRKQGMDEAMGKGQGALEPLEGRVQGLEKGMEEMKNMVTILNNNMEALMGMLKESSLKAK
ncbi:hypothetical protein CGMCC3_g17713 [Colletotrichum fructicola]|uniref:J domain-containing protein n=1 Tax=Colletotrichum fructicola (strain Nara gc5) TaxID=1213859 RepID=A0A7J6IG74_COLFN|nr:uncharacterized protein CGMCC3_g17713 [Colletotrichum fructicola]KAE9566113.1 hypothetical protein CGMCC3_g17713 [Colletotrichum fructicola]KAF4474945.1 hypothetical protein CGGC5_v015957 [Colletotrichum fructicola Nara gc5]